MTQRFSLTITDENGNTLTTYFGELPIELPHKFQARIEFIDYQPKVANDDWQQRLNF